MIRWRGVVYWAAVWLVVGGFVYAQTVRVPVYSTRYDERDGNNGEADREILARLGRVEKKLDAIYSMMGGKGDNAPGIAAVKKNCAACHGAAVAEEAGGAFVLLDSAGELAAVEPDGRKRVVEKVSRGSMPPAPRKLDEAERASILKLFRGKP